ncbi:hypothetical protein G7046_g916 [Stylonectria norvegica]|nr:hypothetical protein G7046_g916 [Stylonectria norvegica]
MALNGAGTFRRTGDNEAEDADQLTQNLLNESWKEWPNEAAFDRLEEHRGPIPLAVKGDIPVWAAGALYRTGPGQSSVETTANGMHYTSHWFDGFAQTHRFDIAAPSSPDQKTYVRYSSRRQAEDWAAHVKEKGWRSGMTFAQKADPCVGLFSKFTSSYQPTPKFANNNVTVQVNIPGLNSKGASAVGHRAGTQNIFVGSDYSGLVQIDPQSLEPLGMAQQKALHPDLDGPSSCAHSQQDPESGDYFNYNLAYGRNATYRFFRVNAATGTTDILATVSEPDISPAYIHSFFLTENYVVLCVPSAHFGWKGIKIVWKRNIVDAIEPFDKSKACQWIVVDRKHGKGVVGRFTTPAAFFFHSINAFEEHVKDQNGIGRTELCLDHVMYDNLDVITSFYYDIILDRNDATKKYWLEDGRSKKSLARLVRYRYRLPLLDDNKQSKIVPGVAEEVLSIPSPHIGELPTINPAHTGKAYRYVYSTPNRGLSTVVDSLGKTDLHTREALIWSGPKGHSPGEPIFVARPGATEEDDGVLLSVVVDGTLEKTYLLCLDAKTMTELGRAEAEFAIGAGFHGVHVAMAQVDGEQSVKPKM